MGIKTSVVFICDWCARESETRWPEFSETSSTASSMICEECMQKYTIADLAKRLSSGLIGAVKRLFK